MIDKSGYVVVKGGLGGFLGYWKDDDKNSVTGATIAEVMEKLRQLRIVSLTTLGASDMPTDPNDFKFIAFPKDTQVVFADDTKGMAKMSCHRVGNPSVQGYGNNQLEAKKDLLTREQKISKDAPQQFQSEDMSPSERLDLQTGDESFRPNES